MYSEPYYDMNHLVIFNKEASKETKFDTQSV